MKTISLEYFTQEFSGVKNNLVLETALTRYLQVLQEDNIQDINFWAIALLNQQALSIKEKINGKQSTRRYT